MELENEFEVGNPIDEVWEIFSNVEQVASCLPGAQVEAGDGNEYSGMVKVKVGPITTQYKGVATILERNDAEKKMVIKAEGRDSKGAGNASANINVALSDFGGKTKVAVVTDLSVTGKVAQFGRGVMADISAKLMGQFADNLQNLLSKNGDSREEEGTPKGKENGKEGATEEVEAVDILEGASKGVKMAGNVAGAAMKAGQGIKKAFTKKPPKE